MRVVPTTAAAMILAQIAAGPAAAQSESKTISGEAEVHTATKLTVGGTKVMLYGIAAPRKGEKCTLPSGRIDCGKVATSQLKDLTAGAEVTCEIRGKEIDPPNAKCTVDDYDLSEGMVHAGWARPVAFAPDSLKQAQLEARGEGNGLWAGEFPASVRAVAHEPDPTDAPGQR